MARTPSHTARIKFLTCPRAFMFDYEMRLRLRTEATGRRMGSAFSACLEHRDPFAHRPAYEQMIDHAQSHELAENLLVERGQIEVLAAAYLNRYPDQGIRREVAFVDPVLGQGALDGIIGSVGVEDKLLTKNFWRDADERKLAIDLQVTAYFAAMRRLGTPLDKMLYRVTFKPTITWRRSRQPETYPEYIDRLRQRIADDPSETFRQYELYRSDEQLDEFEQQAAEVTRMIQQARRRGAWPQNTSACTQYGECAFLSLCRKDSDAQDKYEVRPKAIVVNQLQHLVLGAVQQALVPPRTAAVAMQAGVDTRAARNALRALSNRGLVVLDNDEWVVASDAPVRISA